MSASVLDQRVKDLSNPCSVPSEESSVKTKKEGMFDQIVIESMLVTVSVADNFEMLVIESLYFNHTYSDN